ncbi:MAG: GNAT family N-acetyltransferase [Bacteroidales bacterium]|nr:GNAT family N-acetyltransferase [Bacteroidales bacterium]
MKIISNYAEINFDSWRTFINEHPDGNVFQTPAFFEVCFKTELLEPFALFAVENNIIKGVLLAVIQKEYRGILGSFTVRSIVRGGPLVYDNIVAILLLEEYNNLIKGKAIYSQIRNIFSVEKITNAFEQTRFKYEEHLDIIIDLNKSENVLWSEIHKNRKKEIKKGLRNGLLINLLDDVDDVRLAKIYSLLENLYKKKGLPVPSLLFFKHAIEIFSKNKLARVFTATLDNKIIAFRIVFTFKNCIYDWYAASDEKYLAYRPNDVLPWEIIKWGTKNNFKVFDFGGAGKPNIPYGVREYKLKFGGELVNFGRFFRVHNNFLFHIGKLGFQIFRLIK